MGRATEAYQIPISTLRNKITEKHSLLPGDLTALSHEEELTLCSEIENAAEWGLPPHKDEDPNGGEAVP